MAIGLGLLFQALVALPGLAVEPFNNRKHVGSAYRAVKLKPYPGILEKQGKLR